MNWHRLAALFLVVAAISGALGLGMQPFAVDRALEAAMVPVCLVALGAFAVSFLAGLDRRRLVDGDGGAVPRRRR